VCKFCWVLVVMLAGLSGFLAFKFMVVGETEPSPDGRTAIVVTPQERDQILLEKKLGFDTHSRFDQLGLDAEQQMSPEHISQQLGALMGNCVACHKTYRLATN